MKADLRSANAYDTRAGVGYRDVLCSIRLYDRAEIIEDQPFLTRGIFTMSLISLALL